MDLIRRISSDVPSARLFSEDKPALLVCWWCSLYAIVIILFRIFGRYVRAEQMFLDDRIMMGSIIPLLGHMAFLHVVLLFGTNNALTEGLSDENIHRREIGSGLVLVVRLMEAIYLWTIKYSTLVFLRNLTEQVRLRSHRVMLLAYQIFLAVTLGGVIISIVSECHPITHYWQVTPDPGPSCRQAPAQFIIFSIAHALTNIWLVILPLPIVLKAKIPTKRKLGTLLLLSLPILNVAFTIGSSPHIAQGQFLEHTRALFGSMDILLNAFWANAVVLCALLQDKGAKKAKYKHTSEYDPKERNQVGNSSAKMKSKARERELWDSEEELIMGDIQGGNSTKIKDKSMTNIGGGKLDIEMSPLPAAKHLKPAGSIRIAQSWDVQVEER